MQETCTDPGNWKRGYSDKKEGGTVKKNCQFGIILVIFTKFSEKRGFWPLDSPDPTMHNTIYDTDAIEDSIDSCQYIQWIRHLDQDNMGKVHVHTLKTTNTRKHRQCNHSRDQPFDFYEGLGWNVRSRLFLSWTFWFWIFLLATTAANFFP